MSRYETIENIKAAIMDCCDGSIDCSRMLPELYNEDFEMPDEEFDTILEAYETGLSQDHVRHLTECYKRPELAMMPMADRKKLY